jgi:N-acyl-D-aspartate/D-glutamate deacylase
MLDLVIKGGTVVDGSGRPGVRTDVGVKDGRVVKIGQVTDDAAKTIDATGKIVAPGFIDVHTHYDAQAFWDANLSPSPLHGITTVIGGNCGFTIAPLEMEHGEYLMKMLARVEGMPLTSLETGVPWGSWHTFGEWLDCLEGKLAVNAGFMVGHSALRRNVMGERSIGTTSSIGRSSRSNRKPNRNTPRGSRNSRRRRSSSSRARRSSRRSRRSSRFRCSRRWRSRRSSTWSEPTR